MTLAVKNVVCMAAFSIMMLLSGFAAASQDYTLEYAMIDCSGGAVSAVSGTVFLSEDILTGDVQGLSDSWSDTYNISSVLRWPAPPSAASNWVLYE